MAKRIQRHRYCGWRMPAGAVYVGRPTKWGNPHVGIEGNLTAVDRYRDDLFAGRLQVSLDDVCRELAGKDLACWCPLDRPCHADVLLGIANGI